jgi:hypothetical protein
MRGRRRTLLLDILKKKRRYWNLKEEALDRTPWRTRFRRGYGLIVRQNAHYFCRMSHEVSAKLENHKLFILLFSGLFSVEMIISTWVITSNAAWLCFATVVT